MHHHATFRVFGIPRPKGSTSTFPHRHGPKCRPGCKRLTNTTSASKGLKEWEWAVALAAKPHAPAEPSRNPWRVSMRFWMPRAKSTPHNAVHHLKRGDVDKLVRGCLDPLSGMYWLDDCQITDLSAHKIYAPHGEQPGAVVTVTELVE